MKSLLALALFGAASAAQAAPLKTCQTTLNFPGSPSIETTITVNNERSATITQNGQSYDEVVSISSLPIRAGLKTDSNIDELNLAEGLIVHALILSSDPDLKDSSNAGFDVSKARSATIYKVGKDGNIGMTAIVDAKDEAGKALGSFLGGFLVSACK